MKKSLTIFQRILSVAVVLLMMNVYSTEYLCNLHHAREEAEEEHCDGDHHDDADHHKDADHHHDEGGNCCKLLTSSFFSNLNNPPSFNFLQKNIQTDFSFAEVSVPVMNVFDNEKEFFSYKSPPPKIPDIRTFTASFLI